MWVGEEGYRAPWPVVDVANAAWRTCEPPAFNPRPAPQIVLADLPPGSRNPFITTERKAK